MHDFIRGMEWMAGALCFVAMIAVGYLLFDVYRHPPEIPEPSGEQYTPPHCADCYGPP